jgi:hypothetical protein
VTVVQQIVSWGFNVIHSDVDVVSSLTSHTFSNPLLDLDTTLVHTWLECTNTLSFIHKHQQAVLLAYIGISSPSHHTAGVDA